MMRQRKKQLWTALLLIAVGAALFVGALAQVNFDFTGLSTHKFQTSTYAHDEAFDSISVCVETAEVIFVPSEDGVCRVVCHEEERLTHSVKTKDGTLWIDTVDTRRWYDHIGISFRTPTVTVYLPKTAYASLSVRTVTGDVVLSDSFCFDHVSVTGTTADLACRAAVSKSVALHTTTGSINLDSADVETVELSATTGKITVSEVACRTLAAKSSTGQIKLADVLAEESLHVETTTGAIRFDGCDAAEITAKTVTGTVRGTLRSEKIFVTATKTGSVSVPGTASGGVCEITTSTGDIKIEIEA